jgi:hypothetical protein
MERFDCGSSLYISLARVLDGHSFKLSINLRHEKRHMAYFRVDMPPAALDIMREHAETSSPAGLVAVIQEKFPHVTAAQVRRAWIEITETFWKYDSNQSVSVQQLLADLQERDEIDDFKITFEEGVEGHAWGVRDVGERIGKTTDEVAVDATCEFALLSRILLYAHFSKITQTLVTSSCIP